MGGMCGYVYSGMISYMLALEHPRVYDYFIILRTLRLSSAENIFMHVGNSILRGNDTLWSGSALPNRTRQACHCVHRRGETPREVSPERDGTIKRFTHNTSQSLHPAGGVVVAVPRPCSTHSSRIQGKTATGSLYGWRNIRAHYMRECIVDNGSALLRMRACSTRMFTCPLLAALSRYQRTGHLV